MTDQPKPEKPSAVPEAAEPKSAEKEAVPVAGSQPAKPEAPVLPVTEKMPAPLPAVGPASKPPAPVLPRVDTKPVAPPPGTTTPEKVDTPAAESKTAPPTTAPLDSKPAAPAASSADGKPAAPAEVKPAATGETTASTSPPTVPEANPLSSAPLEGEGGETQPATPKTETTAEAAAPETKPAPVETPAKPAAPEAAAAEKPVSSPVEPDKTTEKIPEPSKDDTLPPGNHQRVTQRFGEAGTPAAGVAPGTICPSCGHRNRPGTLICDNCGTNLIAGVRAAVGTRDLESAQQTAPTDQPVLSDTQSVAVKSAGSTQFNEDMVLRIEIEGGATPMLVYPKQEIILGRRDPNTGTLPDVDLTAYAGYRMGVSRTHASIRLQDKVLNLSDRGSSNGTFLNGNRLTAHHPYPLRDGDEIRLGQMLLKIYFQSNKGRK